MSKKRYLTGGLLGLAALGACIVDATAGRFNVTPKKVAWELVNATSGKMQSTDPISFRLDDGIGNGTKIIFTLTNAMFPNATALNVCVGTTSKGSGSAQGDNATIDIQITDDLPGNTWLLLGNGSTCNQTFNIKIPGGINKDTSIEISGKVKIGNTELESISNGTLYTIKQQTSADPPQKGISYISYEHYLKKFKNGETKSEATLYIKNATLDIAAANGNFTIEVAGDMSGVANGTWGNSTHRCTLTLDGRTKLTNSTCPMSSVTNSTNTRLTINITGIDPLTPRKFYTTVKTKADDNQFAREITLLDNVITHEWVLPGTTFYIPFVRHNETLKAQTFIKLQAQKIGNETDYNVAVKVLRSDGNMDTVPSSNVCLDEKGNSYNGKLVPGKTCIIRGKDLIDVAGKDETFAVIYVDKVSEDNVSCFVAYFYDGQLRRVPCKVKGGTIVE